MVITRLSATIEEPGEANLIQVDSGGLPSLLHQAAQRYPERTAMDFLGQCWNYKELSDLSELAAAGLCRLGVKPGDRVGLCLPNTHYYVIMFFSVLRAGAIVVQFNPLYTAREIERQAKDAGCTLLVAPDLAAPLAALTELAAQQPELRIITCPMSAAMPALPAGMLHPVPATAQWIAFADLIAHEAPPPLVQIHSNDIAVLQYTGGTTGIPKGAMLTHANLMTNCAQLISFLGFNTNDQHRTIAVLPLFHVFALTSVLLLSVSLSAEIVLLPRYELKLLTNAMRLKSPTIFSAVPTIYGAIAALPPEELPDFSSLSACVSGGAPLPFDVRAAFESVTGARLVEGYGLSEASPVVSCNPIDRPPRDHSAGLALPGTHIEIRRLNDLSTKVPVGETGEIWVQGPQIMAGYWNRASETADVLRDGYLRTGDVGYLDEAGYLFLVDRIKDVILCSGYNVYPRVIEEALYEHPSISEALVVGMADPYRGETPHAFIVARPGIEIDLDELKTFLASRINKIEMPAVIEIWPSLPKTVVGKLSKIDLKSIVSKRMAAG